MMKLAMTYETVTHESAENGDFEDTGFVFEDTEYSAHELAQLITREGFTEPSESKGVPRWLTRCGETDYRTGTVENRSIHPGRDIQSQKAWANVLRICGIIRD